VVVRDESSRDGRPFVVLNGPHPERLLRGLRNPIQLLRSWYIFFFQIPVLPEAIARLDGYAFFLKPLREEPRSPDAFPPSDIARYVEAFSKPGAVEAMVNWYRAMLRGTAVPIRTTDVEALVLWGPTTPSRSRAGHSVARSRPERTRGLRANATHWIQHDAPARVKRGAPRVLPGLRAVPHGRPLRAALRAGGDGRARDRGGARLAASRRQGRLTDRRPERNPCAGIPQAEP